MSANREYILDELLVLRCQEGDSEAMEHLVRHWHHRLVRFARNLTGSPEAAEDAVQEAWVAISRGITRLRDSASFPAWAHRIVRNKVHDWTRRDIRRRHLSEEIKETRDRETQVQSNDWEQALNMNEILERMPEETRTILSLRYEENFTVEEIAEILSIPKGTVKSRLFRAREALKAILESGEKEILM